MLPQRTRSVQVAAGRQDLHKTDVPQRWREEGSFHRAMEHARMHTTTRMSPNQRKAIDAGTRTAGRLQYLQPKFAKGCGPVPLVFL